MTTDRPKGGAWGATRGGHSRWPWAVGLALGLTAVVALITTSSTQSTASTIIQQQAPQASSTATRALMYDSDWAREAAAILEKWRASLFGRMAHEYSQAEDAESGHGGRHVGRIEPRGFEVYNLFNPFLNCSNGPTTRVGNDGDGGKIICMDESLKTPGCIVYSLGSAGDYSFEQSMLEATPCEVHTFDCTFNGQSLGDRHFYHKKCIGLMGGAAADIKGTLYNEAKAADFIKYEDIMAQLNHTHVELLKIDIEGFEYDVFSSFAPSCGQPKQIAMEIHMQDGGKFGLYNNNQDAGNFDNLFWSKHQVSVGELAVFFGHLANMGYGVVSREDNTVVPGLACCAEFTFIQVEKPAHC